MTNYIHFNLKNMSVHIFENYASSPKDEWDCIAPSDLNIE